MSYSFFPYKFGRSDIFGFDSMILTMIVICPSLVPLARNHIIWFANLVVEDFTIDKLSADGFEGHIFLFY